jgi:CubicO group peptidase (beta-lactamase class C family)
MSGQQAEAAVRRGGGVEPGFERVAHAFEENFTSRGELGASFAAVLDGRSVVDLWGGLADGVHCRPWQRDTMQPIFSGTKGLTALCMAMLIDRGLLKLEDPVCQYWPEFAANGKQEITVAEMLSHRARLPGVRRHVSLEDVLDPEKIATLLAAQAPERDPRAAFIYHARTIGWICDGLIRRIDGRSTGRFFAEEVARPLGLDLWIGLPAELERRVAVLQYGPDWGQSAYGRPGSFPGDELWAMISENPKLYPVGELPWNLPAFHAAEIPSSNAIGSARSIALLYGALARGGEIDGIQIISSKTLAAVLEPLASGVHPYTGELMSFGAGFALQTEDAPLGPAEVAFGHSGAGGSVHGAWPHLRVGFSYAMNELRDGLDGDGRPGALLEALYECGKANDVC